MPARCVTCDHYVRPDTTNQAHGLCQMLGPGTKPEGAHGAKVRLASGLVYVAPDFGCTEHAHTPGAQETSREYAEHGYRTDFD